MSTSEIAREQEYVGMLYRRVDELREQAAQRLAAVLREHGGTEQALVERESAVARYADRVARLDAAENGLCFGRLDLRDGRRHYIGRIGIHGDPGDTGDEDREPLLLDWRAPAARPFYVATAAAPEGVRRRRHITLRGRRVVALDDEILDGDAAAGEEGLTGEAALLAAVTAGRTGRMRDIVETIQAEQDEIIRAGHHGVLVVQGGPGTGKTAVALHRAAYLLYTHPRLAERGVLVVGPNATFLRYIGQVLPGLGETSVLLSTVGGLFPGVAADRPERPEAAEIKGRAVMAEVIAAAVRDRQAPPRGDIEIAYEGQTLRLAERDYLAAAERARGRRATHNQARRVFLAELTGLLARQVAERLEAVVLDDSGEPLDGGGAPGVLGEADRRALIAAGYPRELLDAGDDPPGGRPLLGEAELAELRGELLADPGVRAALRELWPALTPQRLLADLYADPGRLASAAPMLSERERASLRRAPGDGWTAADVPLLDEAAELLGELRTGPGREEIERARSVAYAQGVLDITAGSRSTDLEEGEEGEILTAADVIDARRLAERHATADARTLAERAAADRSWAFGHVIVDEAQELSQMAWRMLMRRCPARSMTIVGDVAQTGDAAGTTSWDRVLRPHVGDRWRLARLTVNYRTPAEIMTAATGVLAALHAEDGDGAGLALEAPSSVRETGVPPWRLETTPGELPGVLAAHAARELAALGEGRAAVIVPDARLGELGAAVAAAVPGVSYGADPDLECRLVVLGVRQAKGLEFDSVLIADPAAILAAGPRGRNDLYVAMTRATRRLGVIHPGPPPGAIAAAVPEPAAAAP